MNSNLRQRGSVYVFVLGAASLAAAAGLTAIALHNARLDRVTLAAQAQRATEDAQSALEYAVATIAQDPAGTTWRTSPALSFNAQKYFGADASALSITIGDPIDSDLSDSNLDPVGITVEATLGPCVQSYALTMEPSLTPMSCLDYAIVVGGSASLSGSAQVYTGGLISTGRSWESDSDPRPVVADALLLSTGPVPTDAPVMVLRPGGVQVFQIDPDEGAAGAETEAPVRTGPSYNPATHDAVIPNAADIVTHYVSAGTLIHINDLPGGGELRDTVLSPASNPYGAANPSGIYVIECKGGDIDIRNTRVHGTLVLLNAGTARLREGVCIEPAKVGLPALIVGGSANFEVNVGDLSESTTGVNYNPSGSPYDGSSDADTSDVYPSWIKGLTYITGSLEMTSGATTIHGVLVVRGNLLMSDATQLRVEYVKPADTVPGFATITGMSITPGSLQRVVE